MLSLIFNLNRNEIKLSRKEMKRKTVFFALIPKKKALQFTSTRKVEFEANKL